MAIQIDWNMKNVLVIKWNIFHNKFNTPTNET